MSKLKQSLLQLLQTMGKSLMLPVSVLPIAGILLGLGASDIGFIPPWLQGIMKNAGESVFISLPLIFAIGVALGLTKNDGVSALAAIVGLYSQNATLGFVAEKFGHKTESILGVQTLNTGVFGGILAGLIAGYLFNRFYTIELPDYLGFFAGKRFVPIITSLSCVLSGIALSFIWPNIQSGIEQFSQYAAYGNPLVSVFIYGVVERSLIPFGLHHIWNVPFFFEMGSFTNASGEVFTGDIARFMNGDPQAGILSGGYLFKMFGLPAAALAIWHTAKPERKKAIGGIMLSAAFTSFLTGITEPIEFSFLVIAPLLYALHALLAGLGFVIAYEAGIRYGFSFSHGLIDYLILFPLATKPWLILMIGPIYSLVYYFLFRFCIQFFSLPTPGREPLETQDGDAGDKSEKASKVLQALGGASNLTGLDACITRLRTQVKDPSLVDKPSLQNLGARGVILMGNSAQVIFGPSSENLKTQIEKLLQQPLQKISQQEPDQPLSSQKDRHQEIDWDAFTQSLGGEENIEKATLFSHTRLHLVLIKKPNREKWANDFPLLFHRQLKNNSFEVLLAPQENRNCQQWIKKLSD